MVASTTMQLDTPITPQRINAWIIGLKPTERRVEREREQPIRKRVSTSPRLAATVRVVVSQPGSGR